MVENLLGTCLRLQTNPEEHCRSRGQEQATRAQQLKAVESNLGPRAFFFPSRCKPKWE